MKGKMLLKGMEVKGYITKKLISWVVSHHDNNLYNYRGSRMDSLYIDEAGNCYCFKRSHLYSWEGEIIRPLIEDNSDFRYTDRGVMQCMDMRCNYLTTNKGLNQCPHCGDSMKARRGYRDSVGNVLGDYSDYESEVHRQALYAFLPDAFPGAYSIEDWEEEIFHYIHNLTDGEIKIVDDMVYSNK